MTTFPFLPRIFFAILFAYFYLLNFAKRKYMSTYLSTLQRVFSHYKKRKDSLPLGCCALELVDDDDISEWFVQFEYAGGSNVSVRLRFPLDTNNHFPQVFVIQPRLVAPFIHHGAVCSLELLSNDWEMSVEGVAQLLMALHATLSPLDARISIDITRPSYSSAEHESGTRHIESAHSSLLRRSRPTQPSVSKVESATKTSFEVSSQDEFEAALLSQRENDSIEIILMTAVTLSQASFDASRVPVILRSRDAHRCAVSLVDDVFECKPSQVLELHNVAVQCKLFQCRGGRVFFENLTFSGAFHSLEESVTRFTQCEMEGEAAQQTNAFRESFAFADTSTCDVTGCNIWGHPANLSRALIIVTNSAVLRITDSSLRPCLCQRSICGEQDCSISVAGSEIFSGRFGSVNLQSCSGTFSNTAFRGGAVDEERTTGLNVELGGRVDASKCEAHDFYFGFSVIAHSVAFFNNCTVQNVSNGFTVDASRATLVSCVSNAHHVGVFVLSKGKCVVSNSSPIPLSSSLAVTNAGDTATITSFGAKLIGGRFGVEVRDAVFVADGLLVCDSSDTALYAYHGSTANVTSSVFVTAAASAKQSCGVKLFESTATVTHSVCRGFSFGFAAIGCNNTSMEHCFAFGGSNGFTVDNSRGVVMADCGADTNHVGLFVLNKSSVRFANNADPDEHIPCVIRAAKYGIETRGSAVSCHSVHVVGANDSGFNCYSGGELTLQSCTVEGTSSQNCSGVKAWEQATCTAIGCDASGVAFGFAAIGHGTKMTCSMCTTRSMNGFTVDAASVTLDGCVTSASHVGVFVLSEGKAVAKECTLSAANYGVEVRDSEFVAEHTIIGGFSKIGLLTCGKSSVKCVGVVCNGDSTKQQCIGLRSEGQSVVALENCRFRACSDGLHICGSGPHSALGCLVTDCGIGIVHSTKGQTDLSKLTVSVRYAALIVRGGPVNLHSALVIAPKLFEMEQDGSLCASNVSFESIGSPLDNELARSEGGPVKLSKSRFGSASRRKFHLANSICEISDVTFSNVELVLQGGKSNLHRGGWQSSVPEDQFLPLVVMSSGHSAEMHNCTLLSGVRLEKSTLVAADCLWWRLAAMDCSNVELKRCCMIGNQSGPSLECRLTTSVKLVQCHVERDVEVTNDLPLAIVAASSSLKTDKSCFRTRRAVLVWVDDQSQAELHDTCLLRDDKHATSLRVTLRSVVTVTAAAYPLNIDTDSTSTTRRLEGHDVMKKSLLVLAGIIALAAMMWRR